MSNTVRIVFFSDQNGEVEKVLQFSRGHCSECGAEKPQKLTGDQITEIGRGAARAIGNCTHGLWYAGLIEELVRRYPDDIINRAVKQHPIAVEAALEVRGARGCDMSAQCVETH